MGKGNLSKLAGCYTAGFDGRNAVHARELRPVARRRPARSTLVRRWLAVGGLALVGLLYVKPFHAYLQTRHSLDARRAEVRSLEAQKRSLEHRLAATASLTTLEREARRLGYVKPGERLYIVKGISAWRKRLRASLRSRG
jgi:cell division protein FtsB